MAEETVIQKFSDLADGETLRSLKRGYLKSHDREALVSLLSCLRESFVWVPMTVEMSDRDRERLNAAAKAHSLDTFTAEDEMRIRPETLSTPNGLRYFPMFSRKSDIPEAYAKNFSVFEEAVINCIALAKHTQALNGLVLDAFSEPFVIPFDVAEMILNAPKLHTK